MSNTRKWWALGALTLSILAIGLDGTVLSVALPTLARDLHATQSDLQWFTSAFLLTLAAFMLPAGLLGDRIGRKKILLGSLVLFGIFSAACAFSQNPTQFIIARAALGIGGAGIVVMAVSALTVLFNEQERPRALGVWAAANFLALPIGPILGGWLLTNFWWGWVFLMNVPIALIGLVAAFLLVPETRSPKAPGLDPLGVLLSTGGLVAVTYGLIEAGRNGWTDPSALGPIGGGLAALVLFFVWEYIQGRLGGQPLVDLRLFRSRAFTWGTILTGVLALAMVGVLFTMPQYFQGIVGTDAMGSGVRLLPMIAGLVVGALPASAVARVLGTKLTIVLGFLIFGAGMLLGAQTGVHSDAWFISAWMALMGAGLGVTLATAASATLAELDPERAGVGTAVFQALQKMGGPLGAAIMGSVMSTVYGSSLDLTGVPATLATVVKQSFFAGLAVAQKLGSAQLLASVQSAFVQGMDASLLAGAGIAAAGIILALLFMPSRPKAKAQGSSAATKEGSLVVTG